MPTEARRDGRLWHRRKDRKARRTIPGPV